MNHCSAATPDMLQHSSFLSCEKCVQCSGLPSLDRTFDSHQWPEVPFLVPFCVFTAKKGFQWAGNIFTHLLSFQKGTRILSRQFYRTGEKIKKFKKKIKKGLNHTVINMVIMPV